MQEVIKNNFSGGMNTDDSRFVMPANCYEDALNISRIKDSANEDNAISNIVGNQIIPYTYKPSGIPPKTIGRFDYHLKNALIYFVWHPNGFHSILYCDLTLRTITKIFENLTDSNGIDILGFTEDGKITSVNLIPRDEGDLLLFLDSLGRPSQMDISKFMAGAYTPVTRAMIDKIKKPPLSPPNAVYTNDTAVRSNYLTGLYRFKYRFVYDDYETSVFSPISKIPLPINALDSVYTGLITNNNVINVSINSGDKNVKSVELCVSFVNRTNNWSDFQSVEVIKKSDKSIPDNTDFAYSFYNSSTYPNVDINESLLLFSWIPDQANAQDMPKGLAYAGITEGFSKDEVENAIITINTIAAGNGGVAGSLNAVVTYDGTESAYPYPGDKEVMNYTFSGIPAVGTVVSLNIRKKSDHSVVTTSTYTTIAGDTSDIVARKITANNTALYTEARYLGSSIMSIRIPHFYWEQIPILLKYSQMVIAAPASSSTTDSIPSWKWSSQGTIARQYFTANGKTNGVYYFDRVSFPAYAENGAGVPLLPYINYKINDIPPIWADSFTFLFTKDATTWLMWETNAVIVPSEDFIYFEVTGLLDNADKNPTTSKVLSYTFKDGDRIRIIRDISTNTVLADTFDTDIIGLVIDPIIDTNVTIPAGRQFIKIKKTSTFASIVATDNYVIELYSPAQQLANATNQAYYEIGRQYYIIDAGTATRRHGGEVTDQVVGVTPAEFNFYGGNAYFRARSIILNKNSSGYAIFNVMDRNFVDYYYSAVNNIDGRASVIDPNAGKKYYPTLIRFGQAYQTDTNINGLGTFYPNDFDEYEVSYGEIIRIRMKGNYLKIFQRSKIGVVPLFAQITKDASGTENLIVTSKLLNPIQYRTSNYGLSAPESLASFQNSDYGCDTDYGIVWRDSQNGVVPISQIFNMNSWAKRELPQRKGKTKIYGTFHDKRYILALEAAPVSCATIQMVDASTTVICATIQSVSATAIKDLACAVINSVNAESVKGGAFKIQNGTASTGSILNVLPYVYSYDAGIQDFPLDTAGEIINGAHTGFSALIRVQITTTQDAILSLKIGLVIVYSLAVTSDGIYGLGFYTVPAGVDVEILLV